MRVYETRYKKIPGTGFAEVKGPAWAIYNHYVARTKRKPYIRSAYFKSDKIFLEYFWFHLWKKNWRDRMRRLKYLPAALDLIKNSTFEPLTKENPNGTGELLHRFAGLTKDEALFYVQIKEDKKTNKKFLISIFPKTK